MKIPKEVDALVVHINEAANIIRTDIGSPLVVVICGDVNDDGPLLIGLSGRADQRGADQRLQLLKFLRSVMKTLETPGRTAMMDTSEKPPS